MQDFTDDKTPYKKKSNKKTPKKADHKHEYELVEKQPILFGTWFNYIERCKFCGKSKSEIHFDEKE